MNAPMTREQVDSLTDIQLLLRIARESLLVTGRALPLLGDLQGLTQEIAEPAPAKKPRKKRASAPTPDWSTLIHTCPQCGRKGTVEKEFGTRVAKGKVRLQSWCLSCRGKSKPNG